MITDTETDFLHLSDLLPRREPFWDRLETILCRHDIPFAFLPFTKDVWCVDFMPVQIGCNRFIQFRYSPDYLQNKEWADTITDPSMVTTSLNISPAECDLIIDGGNIVKGKDWIIVTDKILVENPAHDRKAMVRMLETALEARPIIIPREPYDFTGHADGMIRWYDDSTVLINRYRKNDKPAFQQKLRKVLRSEGLSIIDVPYNPYSNESYDSARGLYINYLQMKDILILPVFDLAEDDGVVQLFEELFPATPVEQINATQIAEDGGVLNCVTWNIKR